MFRFTIRDVLWAMVVVGIAACWYRDRMSMAAMMARSTAELAAGREKLSAEWKAVTVKRREADAKYKSALDTSANARKLDESVKKGADAASGRIHSAEEAELEKVKAESALLGAPQPKPLPPGFGDLPTSQQ